MASTSTVGEPGKRLLAAAGMLLAICACAAVAQTPSRPRTQPPAKPQAPQNQPQTQTAPSQPPVPVRFEIKRYVVDGNTLLSQKEVDSIVTPFAGKDRDFGDIQKALEALQAAYSKRGYNAVRVSVPEQDIRAGEVRLKVVEARIRRVKVQDNRFFSEKNVRAGLPALKEGGSPNTQDISSEAQLVNENPAKQVTVALQAADDPGQVDATIRVTDEKPWRASAYVDNTGTSSTGNTRLGVGFSHANLSDHDDVLNVQYITSPGHFSDVKIVGAGYRLPVYRWGGIVDALAGYSSVNSGTVQGVFNVSGSGDVFGLRYTQLLGRIESYDHRLAIGLDYRAYKNNVTFSTAPDQLVPNITVRPVSLAYTGRLSSIGQDLSFNVSYARNIPGGANGDDDAFAATGQRDQATPKYNVVRENVAYSRLLPKDFIFRAVANAQQTHDILVAGEQFGMGGVDSVRGYHEREVANDIGWRASLEAYGPDFGSWFGKAWRARALIFTDAARGHDNTPQQNPDSKLGSYGAGVRANMGKSLAIRLDLARVTHDAGTRVTGDYHANFAVAYSY